MTLAKRMQDIQPFRVMDILARAKKLEKSGHSIIHMEVGEPDFPTPEEVVSAAKKALDQGLTHYTAALGLPELRNAIAEFYQQRYGVDVSPEQVVITPGGSGALLLVMGILVDPGCHVLMADPGYPCNRHFVRLMEGNTINIPVNADTGYQLNLDLVKHYWSSKTSVVMLASPSNPTGTIIGQEKLLEIIEFATQRNAVVIVDEIYHGLVYDELLATAAGLSDKVFVINSFSKYFNMTGWRLGWIISPKSYVSALDKLAQNIFLSAPTVSQYAALAAFQPQTIELLEQRRSLFKERRDYLLPELKQMGFDININPQGAFYIYANCRNLAKDSMTLSNRLLEEVGVAITPGADFGQNGARQHVRFAYTTSLPELHEAVARLKVFFH